MKTKSDMYIMSKYGEFSFKKNSNGCTEEDP